MSFAEYSRRVSANLGRVRVGLGLGFGFGFGFGFGLGLGFGFGFGFGLVSLAARLASGSNLESTPVGARAS